MTVADRIRERRRELNLSQSELAQKAGYTDKTSISKLEHAENDISMKQISRLAEALETTPAYLMGWEDKTIPKGFETAQEIFRDEIGKIESKKVASDLMYKYAYVTTAVNYKDNPNFFDDVERYYKYKFMVHLWSIDFDVQIIMQANYFIQWKHYMIDRDFRPLIFIGNEEMCNMVRAKYGVKKMTYEDATYLSMIESTKPDFHKLLDKAELLNEEGYERLLSYADDLLKIYQYRRGNGM